MEVATEWLQNGSRRTPVHCQERHGTCSSGILMIDLSQGNLTQHGRDRLSLDVQIRSHRPHYRAEASAVYLRIRCRIPETGQFYTRTRTYSSCSSAATLIAGRPTPRASGWPGRTSVLGLMHHIASAGDADSTRLESQWWCRAFGKHEKKGRKSRRGIKSR